VRVSGIRISLICNAFVKAVSAAYGISLTGLADDIVTTILGFGWEQLGKDGVAAKAAADSGNLVVGGLKGSDQNPPKDHGHVVIVVRKPIEIMLFTVRR
jgi:hypothetical protein